MKVLPWVLLALVVAAAVVIYHLVTAGADKASVTLGGITVGPAGGADVPLPVGGGGIPAGSTDPSIYR